MTSGFEDVVAECFTYTVFAKPETYVGVGGFILKASVILSTDSR
jgi:hypothetical protein